MNPEANHLKQWRSLAAEQGIDGLLLTMSAFCAARPDLGRMLAASLRANEGKQIGEWSLACAAEIFSQTARDEQPLLRGILQRWTQRKTGKTGTNLAWFNEVAWLSKDQDEEDTMDPAVMYLTGCIPEPEHIPASISIGQAKAAILAAAAEGYYAGEEFAQRMMKTPESLDRIASAIARAMEPFEIEMAAGPAKIAVRNPSL
jgi:hypothetical protein